MAEEEKKDISDEKPKIKIIIGEHELEVSENSEEDLGEWNIQKFLSRVGFTE